MHLLLDQANADVRVELGMAEAEFAQRTQRRASAELFRAIDEVLREAAAHPEVFVLFTGADAVEFAVRAAAADLAVRLNLAEPTVRAHAHTARVLRERTPMVWAWFLEGEISTQNAVEIAALAIELPPERWVAFDDQILEPARTLAPARFRTKVRALRDRLHTESLQVRRDRARADRRVWIEVESDGMGWLHATLPADALALIKARLDESAFDLFTVDDETRTMNQLRADVLSDLLTDGTTTNDTGSAGKVGVTVALTVPVLSLLGQSTEPAILEGVGPIDIETARRLTADAPSVTRVLTDPITGAILTMDAKQYRPTAALKRWLGLRDVTCTFPGCGRRASGCDLDHITAWADGGTTTAHNLAHLCRKHHTMKHQTKWRVDRPPGESSQWTSPTGHTRTSDPPPY